jgi:hypothetical protein
LRFDKFGDAAGSLMQKTLTAKYRFTLDEFSCAMSYFRRVKITIRNRLPLWFLGWFFVLAPLYTLFDPKEDFTHKVGGCVVGFAIGFYILVYPRISARKAVQKAFDASKIQDEELAWEIQEECVAFDGPLGSMNGSWRIFEEAILGPLGVVLCTQGNLIYWLPRWCFSEENFELLADLVERKIDKFKVLK